MLTIAPLATTSRSASPALRLTTRVGRAPDLVRSIEAEGPLTAARSAILARARRTGLLAVPTG